MGAGRRFAGLDLAEGPDDENANEAEQRKPAEDVDERPEGSLARELAIEKRLRRVQRIGRADVPADGLLRASQRVLELLTGLRDRVENFVLVNVHAAREQRLRDRDADGA